MSVTAGSYQTGHETAGPEASELVVVLNPVEPERAPAVTVRLHVPAMPKGGGYESYDACLVFDVGSARRVQSVTLVPGREQVVELKVEANSLFDAWLDGGDCLGYPDGRMTANVQAALPDAGVLDLHLPPVQSPPWRFAASCIVWDVKCGEQALSVYGWFRDGDVDARLRATDSAEFARQGRRADGRLPLAFVDGDREIPVKLVLPEADGNDALLRLVFEPRIEVRLLRLGRSDTEFTAQVQTRQITASARSADGVARLWCEAGVHEFNVGVPAGPAHMSKRAEVLKSGVTRLDIEWNFARVLLQPSEAQQEYWNVAAIEQPDRTAAHMASGRAVYLPPGRYMAWPGYRGPGREFVEFEVTDDATIQLPPLPHRPRADVLLKMDKFEWEPPWTVALYYLELTKDDRAARLQRLDWQPLEVSALPDGLRLKELPDAADIVVFGAVTWYDAQDNEQTRVLQPVRFKVAAGASADARWTPQASLADEWSRLRVMESLDSARLPFATGLARSGRHELVFYDSQWKEVLRHVVEVPAGAFEFPIPPDLRLKLDAADLFIGGD